MNWLQVISKNKLALEIAGLILGSALVAILSLVFENFAIVVKYYFLEHWLGLCIFLVGLIIINKVLKSKQRTKILLTAALVLLALRIDYVVLHKCHFNNLQDYTEIDLGYIERSANGFYTYSPRALDMTIGHREGFSMSLLDSFVDATTTVPQVASYIPKYLLDYYGYKNLDITELLSDKYSCGSQIRWQEIDSDGKISKIGFYTEFPFIENSDLDSIYNLTSKLNYLTDIGVDRRSVGRYLGTIYGGFYRSSGVTYDSATGEWKQALQSINETENILLKGVENIRQISVLESETDFKDLKEFMDVETSNWKFRSNLMRFYVNWERNDHWSAEQSLKETFKHNDLPSEHLEYDNFFDAFTERYFGVERRKIADDDFVWEEVKKGGLVVHLTPYKETFDIYESILSFYLNNESENLNIDDFFKYSLSLHPDSPILNFYWAKSYTLRGKNVDGYKTYLEVHNKVPDAKIVKTFYYIALMNAGEEGLVENYDMEKTVEEYAQTIKLIDEEIVIPDEVELETLLGLEEDSNTD